MGLNMSNFLLPSLPLLNVHPHTQGTQGHTHSAPLLCMAVLIWLLASLPLSLSPPPAQWQKSTAPHKGPAKLVNGGACWGFDQLFRVQSHVPPPGRWSLLEEAAWLHLREVVTGDECRERCSGGMRGSCLVWMSCAFYANKLPQLLTF